MSLASRFQQWMFYMERFTRIVVREVEAAGLMPSRGGPVIFLQIENEYGLVQEPYGEDGEKYVEWYVCARGCVGACGTKVSSSIDAAV